MECRILEREPHTEMVSCSKACTRCMTYLRECKDVVVDTEHAFASTATQCCEQRRDEKPRQHRPSMKIRDFV